ncbi:hypothetical protein E4T44_00910 [Aureobasidium sp. EXF-8845]|nr:hypothetical protein E4T44_00910 [Aureobasidium sp. EXF-8845]KAI4857619.1 hypothetical protein E4T45_00882 [Aureobasidium sp. EXF-8846]
MPPAIVYTDMADPVGGADGVFTDSKFFIVQRVPQRSHYVSLVESNGGTVVKLEAQADYLIADHMRHDAPSGSLSYKFIEEAINQGEIPDDKAFLANRRKSANSTAATSSKKSTRTLFTDDDDKLLYALVHKAKEQGYAIQGNTLYQVLAAHNTRHTMHSWRDRYIKVLSLKPPTAWESYPDAELPPLDTPITDLPSTALPRSTSRSTITSTPKSRVHTPFTEEDDRELRAWVTKKANQGAPLGGNAIYKELEARNPRHTFHSWRDRWFRHLSLREPDGHDHDMDEGIDPQRDESAGTPVEEVTTLPLPKPTTSKTPLKKRPSFRIPPGASASADDASRVAPAAAKIPSTTIEPLVATAAPTTSHPDIITHSTTRPATTSKNQANTPMVRARNLSSPIMSQQTPAHVLSRQDPSPEQPLPSFRHEAVQADSEFESNDDSAFTEQDFKDLLSVALDIQNVCVGRYQESWIKWAKEDGRHTAVEWRSYYERRVLPIVLHTDDAELPESQRTGSWIEFWRHQGQPIVVLPYNRATGVPSALSDVVNEVARPRKSITRHVEPDEEMADTVTHANKPDDALLWSAKRKVQDSIESVEEPATKRQRTVTPPHPMNNNPPTDQVLSQPTADAAIGISSRGVLSPSYHSDEQQGEENSEDQVAGQLRREMAEDKDDRHRLTRGNLARIQAENGLPEDNRGIDIEEDDEDDDQADFATYLASMLPPSLKEKALETVETHESQVDQADEVDEEGDEDILMNNDQHDIEYEIDPALLEVDQPSYQSSAEFQANNCNIHLDVPITQPWEASSLPSQSQSQSQSQHPQRLSTQAIFEAETQAFDAEVPLPPDKLYEEVEISYTTAQTDSQILAEDETWPWIDSQIAIGHAEETVFSALRATSMNPKLAAAVLEAKGKHVDAAGVWTEEDDRVAEGRDAKAIRKLKGKHGKGSVEKRITFLAQWRTDEEIAMKGVVD